MLALVTAGCSSGPTPSPPPDTDGVRAAATQLADALEKKDLTPVAFAGASGPQTDALFQPLVRGMGPVSPQVDVTGVTGDRATLAYRWTFPGVGEPWTYDTTVALTREDGGWRPTWSPTLVQPALDGSNRLSQHRLYPARGELLGEDGDPIVKRRSVVRIGLDKANLAADRQAASATRLAKLVDIDAKAYVKAVEDAGPKAFVPAIVFRETDPDRPSNRAVFAIPGALPVEDDAMLAPSRDFAAALLGRVGPATAEVVKASDGAVIDGDEVGLSGLEKRYDEQMRGTPGVVVQLVPGASASPSPTASPERHALRPGLAVGDPGGDHGLRGQGRRGETARDHAERGPAEAGREVPGQGLRRSVAGRRPAVHGSRARRREQRGHRRPAGRHGRAGAAGVDLQGGLRPRAAPGGARAGLPGRLPAHR